MVVWLVVRKMLIAYMDEHVFETVWWTEGGQVCIWDSSGLLHMHAIFASHSYNSAELWFYDEQLVPIIAVAIFSQPWWQLIIGYDRLKYPCYLTRLEKFIVSKILDNIFRILLFTSLENYNAVNGIVFMFYSILTAQNKQLVWLNFFENILKTLQYMSLGNYNALNEKLFLFYSILITQNKYLIWLNLTLIDLVNSMTFMFNIKEFVSKISRW